MHKFRETFDPWLIIFKRQWLGLEKLKLLPGNDKLNNTKKAVEKLFLKGYPQLLYKWTKQEYWLASMKLPYTAILALMQAVVTTIYKATHELKEHFIQYPAPERLVLRCMQIILICIANRSIKQYKIS